MKHPKLASLFLLLLASSGQGQTLVDRNHADGIYIPLLEKDFDVVEFNVFVGERQVTAMIASPPEDQLNPDPVLLLTIGGPSSHLLPPNDQPANYFWKRGHRVVSLSAPCVASSLGTFGELALKGPDPTLAFIEEAQAVLKYCVDQQWTRSGRVVVTGISRYAYMALRLMAADDQLNIGGGFAPVTDWRDLSELHEIKDRKEIADLRLSLFAEKLAGKKIYLSIGNHDERVGTLSCCQLFLDLNAANSRKGLDGTLVDFFVTPDVGHRSGDEWFERGMEILLEAALAQDGEK